METGWFKSVSLLKTSCPSCSSRTRLIDGHPPPSRLLMGNMECIHGLFPIIARYSFLSEYIYEIGYIVGHCAILFVLCLFFFLFVFLFFVLFCFILFCFLREQVTIFCGTTAGLCIGIWFTRPVGFEAKVDAPPPALCFLTCA